MSSLSGRAGARVFRMRWGGTVQPETARAGSSRTVTASGVVSDRAGTRVPGSAAAAEPEATAWRIDSGEIEGVDVAGLTLALSVHIPGNVLKGNFRVLMFVDERATAPQEQGWPALRRIPRNGK